MKKILFFLMLLFCIPFSIFGITGDGSFGSPYSGPLTTSMNWSGTVYVNGTITIDGFTLTISPGTVVVFLVPSSDIIVTGTGVLTAVGTTGSKIRFTADSDNSGTFGGPGETWGHISFQSISPSFTTPSTIDNCIIEYGKKNDNPFNVNAIGGGIYTEYSYLTISNSLISNNYAGYGGGIFVTQSSPHIFNCIFSNNTASTTGGGLLFYINSPSLVENCVIYNNTSTGPGGAGGVFAGYQVGDIRFYNCVIASNVSTYGSGNNVRLYINTVSPYPSFYNTIIWGSDNSVDYVGNPVSSSDFVNCALQGGADSYTSCINLSGTNSDPTGPNFNNVTPGSEDYRINFISPCRDAGISTGAPLTDFLGNPRVGPYDIGAYEVQYNRWTGSINDDWFTAGNWSANYVPTANSRPVIGPSLHNPVITGSPVTTNSLSIELNSALTVADRRTLTSSNIQNSGTLTITNAASITAPSFINTGTFVVDPTGLATVNSLINNGTINLNSDNANMFSFMFDTYSGTGTTNIGMFVSGGGGTGNWKWHYVAVPADYINDKTMFTSINPYDLIQYDDSQIPNTLIATDNAGWVWHDGYLGGPGFLDLIVGRGYGFYHSNLIGATVNFKSSSLVASLGTLPLQYSGDGKLVPKNYGFNLLGNSLTCGINWDLVTLNGNINSAVYYTINYRIGMYVIGTGGINGATNNIPPLQGFLVKANESGTSINFSGARVHTDQQRYKKSLELNSSDSKGSGTIDSRLMLELNNSGNQDETLICFNDDATNGFDRKFDGLKMLSSGYDQIYTLAGPDKFGINGIPYPADGVIIPVAVKLLSAGSNYKIIASKLQGLDNYKVTLTDKANSNFTVDLKSTNSYTFSSDAGTFPDRFVLTIGTITTGVSDVVVTDKTFNVYAYANALNIDLLNPEWNGKNNTINLYDLTGRKIIQQINVELVKGDLKKIPLNLPQGIYIVEINSGVSRFVGRVVIR